MPPRTHITRIFIGSALLSMVAAPAAANPIDFGPMIGLHVFSVNNELGVPDRPEAPSLRNSVLFGLRVGYGISDVLGIEAEGGIIPSEPRDGEVFDVTTVTLRAHLIAQFGAANPDKKVIPFVVAGGGGIFVADSENEMRISQDGDELLYLGAGVKYRVPNGWGLRFDARAIFPPSSDNSFASMDAELLLGVYKEIGRPEKQKVVEPPPPPPTEVGDADGDGLNDDVDQCIQEPEDKDAFQDGDGCPDLDNDADGVPDTTDDCDLEPEDVDGFSDDDGCPDNDNDADGLPDATDACRDEAEDFDQFQDEDGCPDPDNDGDGVLDPADQCPTELETANGYQDDDGCADDVPKAVKQFTGVIKGITFKVNSDVITKASFKTLDRTVKILNEYPDLKIEIQGHTDDTGGDDYNTELSQRRADSVKAYLVGKGVAEDRLVAKGYGRSAPLINKTTKAARAKNRRVEFVLISDVSPAPANP